MEGIKMLIVNRYTCPIKGKITSQAHYIEEGELIRTYPKMDGFDLEFFSHHEVVLVCDVIRSNDLAKVNIIYH